MPSGKAAWVLAAVALAGCANPAPPGEGATGAPEAFPWSLWACEGASAVFPADGASLADRLPPGFRFVTASEVLESAASLPETGLGRSPPGPLSAALVVDGIRCDGATLLSEENRSTAYGQILAFVVPPEPLRDPAVRTWFLVLDLSVSDAGTRERLLRAGLPVVEGDVELDPREAGRPAHEGGATVRFADASFAYAGTAARPGSKAGGVGFFLPARDGLATWAGTMSWSSRLDGAGAIAIPPGPIRDAAGESAAGEFTVHVETTDATFRLLRP